MQLRNTFTKKTENKYKKSDDRRNYKKDRGKEKLETLKKNI